VGHEDDRLAFALEPEELLKALLLEGRVADRQHLVDQEDLGLHLDRGGESEPDKHPGGVVLELEVDELLEFGECDSPHQSARSPACESVRA